MTRSFGLSKSRITLFEQCSKRLWLSVHRPDLADEEESAARFAEGQTVGDLACALLPDGRMISDEHGLAAAAEATAALLDGGWDRPIFEATFVHDGVLVRVDLMLRGGDGWHVAEVKSSTSVKPYHLRDIATQLWVMREVGVPVVAASIRHINRDFVLAEKGAYAGLFTDSPVDELVEPLIAARPALVLAARMILGGDEPVRQMGAHCDDPFACSFKRYCGRDRSAPPLWPATMLPDTSGKALARVWAERGIDDLTAIPADAISSLRHARIHTATLTGVAYRDREAIAQETDGWAWPRMFLDFETIQFAIPRWLGTGPYQQVPFQFSAHILASDGSLSHHDYLSTDGTDPRRACAEALVALPGEAGAIIAWNAPFERTCLLDLARQFADLGPALTAMSDRLVDLLPVARRHYYHRDMRGSWSLKAVLPTLAPELGYEHLSDVRSGLEAQTAYLEAVDPATTPERRQQIRTALLAYCCRDTEALLVLLERLVG
jgi:hypothetical protein